MTKKTDIVDIIDKVTGEVHQEEIVVETPDESISEEVLSQVTEKVLDLLSGQIPVPDRPKFSPEVFAVADVNSVGKVFFRLLPGEMAAIKSYMESLGFSGKISCRIFPDNRWTEGKWENSQNKSLAQKPTKDDLWKIVLRLVVNKKTGEVKQTNSGDYVLVAIPVCDSPEY